MRGDSGVSAKMDGVIMAVVHDEFRGMGLRGFAWVYGGGRRWLMGKFAMIELGYVWVVGLNGRFLSLKTNLIMVMLMRIKAIYKDEVLRPLQKLGLREKEEILIEIKKHRISSGILKVDPKIVDEVIENEELFE